MKRQSIKSILFWFNLRYPRDWIVSTYNRWCCKLFGHPKPYNQNMFCETCPRCSKIMKQGRSQIKFTTNRGDRR